MEVPKDPRETMTSKGLSLGNALAPLSVSPILSGVPLT